MCNHEIVFSIDAGVNDVMKIEFLKMSESTRIHFSVGETFENAKGSTMINAQGQILQIGFPFSIYLTIDHDISQSEKVEFEFWYLDLDANDKDAKLSVTGYNLVTKDVTGK